VGRDGEGYRFDLAKAEREMYLETGLDMANQIDLLQQIAVLHKSAWTSQTRNQGKGSQLA
jgi:hypothetical protein